MDSAMETEIIAERGTWSMSKKAFLLYNPAERAPRVGKSYFVTAQSARNNVIASSRSMRSASLRTKIQCS